MRVKIEELKERVDAEIESAKKSAKENRKSANLIAGGMASGYSIAGDLEHARNTALLSEQRFDNLIKLHKELELGAKEATPQSVIPVCFVTIQPRMGEKKEYYFVKNNVYIKELNLITGNSPIGKAIFGKKVGEEYSYVSDDASFTGEILEIE